MVLHKRTLYLKDVADYCGLDAEILEQMFETGLINTNTQAEEDFLQEADFELLHRVSRLQNTLGVNLAGIEVIVHMREQILYLQQELRKLQHISAYMDEQKNALER